MYYYYYYYYTVMNKKLGPYERAHITLFKAIIVYMYTKKRIGKNTKIPNKQKKNNTLSF